MTSLTNKEVSVMLGIILIVIGLALVRRCFYGFYGPGFFGGMHMWHRHPPMGPHFGGSHGHDFGGHGGPGFGGPHGPGRF